MKKDSSIELLRIIGCLIVIGVHIPFTPMINNSYDFSRTFTQCILGDGVAIFWVITGCFLFNSTYKKILRKTVKTILIPIILFNLFFFFMNDFIYNGASFWQSILQPKEAYIRLITCFFHWKNSTDFVHMWYMYVYAFLMLLYPLFRSFVAYLDESNQRIKNYILISSALLVLNDISQNQLFGFSHSLIGAFFPAVNLMIYGHILYKRRAVFHAKKWIPIGLLIFLLSNLIRAMLQYRTYQLENPNRNLLFWFTAFGLVCTISLFAFCSSLLANLKSHTLSDIINYFASYTFPIYIVHLPIINLFVKHGVFAFLTDKFISPTSNFITDSLYLLTVIICVFLSAFVLSAAARYTLKAIRLVATKAKTAFVKATESSM